MIADHINKNVKENDLLIITTPVIEHYLKHSINSAYFISPDNIEFNNRSACSGTREIWSNLPLLTSYTALNQLIDDRKNNVWILLPGERGNPFYNSEMNLIKHKVEKYPLIENPDKSLKLFYIPKT
jgi:hypothetical protein